MIRRFLIALCLLPALAYATNKAAYDGLVTSKTPRHFIIMDETAGSTVIIDYGSNANNCSTLSHSPTFGQTSTGISGTTSALSDGTSLNQQLLRCSDTVPNSLGLDVGDWTWEVWALIHGDGTFTPPPSVGKVLATHGASANVNGIAIYILKGTGTIGQICSNNFASCMTATQTGGSYDTWYYFAGTWKLSTTTLSFFANGVAGGTSSTTSGAANQTEIYTMFGDDCCTGYPGNGVLLNGNEQMAAIYPSVLDSTTIALHYNCGSAGLCGNTTSMPYVVERPTFPKFPSWAYLARLATEDGLRTGNYSSASWLPQSFGLRSLLHEGARFFIPPRAR